MCMKHKNTLLKGGIMSKGGWYIMTLKGPIFKPGGGYFNTPEEANNYIWRYMGGSPSANIKRYIPKK